MTEETTDLMDTARLWMVRASDSNFAQWDDLTEWLEADPAHLAAYEAALEEQSWVDDLLNQPDAASVLYQDDVTDEPEQPQVSRARRWWLGGGALAASLAAVAVLTLQPFTSQMIEVQTGPGEHRTITLADGSRVILNGDTRVSYDPESGRHAELAYGEALFEIEHDESRPFVVMAGDTRLVDAGTVFNVVRDDAALEVGVAEGAVIYEGVKGSVRLNPGDVLTQVARGEVRLSRADPGSVGSWNEGVLHFQNAPLTKVANDLTRALGKPVRAGADVGGLRYTGTLAVDGPPDQVVARAAPLLGVAIRDNGKNWEMTLPDGASR